MKHPALATDRRARENRKRVASLTQTPGGTEVNSWATSAAPMSDVTGLRLRDVGNRKGGGVEEYIGVEVKTQSELGKSPCGVARGVRITVSEISTSSIFMTPIPADEGESYPGRSFSISQLIYAAKRKLRRTTLGGRCVRVGTYAS